MMADRFVEMSADGHQNGAIHRIEGWLNVWGKFDRLGSGSALQCQCPHCPLGRNYCLRCPLAPGKFGY